MPPFGKLLSPGEIRLIAEYIATLPSTTAAATAVGQTTATPTPAPSPTPVVSTDQATTLPPPILQIAVNGDLLEFDKNKIEIAASTEVVLVFNNVYPA